MFRPKQERPTAICKTLGVKEIVRPRTHIGRRQVGQCYVTQLTSDECEEVKGRCHDFTAGAGDGGCAVLKSPPPHKSI